MTAPTSKTALLDLLGRRFHGHAETDAELLADDPIAWPEDCGAAEEIRVARAQYQAGNLENAYDAVIMAQISVER